MRAIVKGEQSKDVVLHVLAESSDDPIEDVLLAWGETSIASWGNKADGVYSGDVAALGGEY